MRVSKSWLGQELTDIFSLFSCGGGSQDASWRGETQEARGDQRGAEEQKDEGHGEPGLK